MADSAYTPKELRPHTDSTYSLDAPGLQLLLCLSYDAIGGESVMVDGFAVADQLRQDDAALYDAISRIDVTGIYKGDGTILEASRPILRHDSDGQLVQVTFNNYDRKTVHGLPNLICAIFTQASAIWMVYIMIPHINGAISCKPGQMLIFDNWRVLHGRGAFPRKTKNGWRLFQS
jgi:trimethyllysine dioxygenase